MAALVIGGCGSAGASNEQRKAADEIAAMLDDTDSATSQRLREADVLVPNEGPSDSGIRNANCSPTYKLEDTVECRMVRASTFEEEPLGSIGAVVLNNVRVSESTSRLTWDSVTFEGL